MKRAQALRSSTAPRSFWRAAMLCGAGTAGAALPAHAASYYWQDPAPGYYYQQHMLEQPRREPRPQRKPVKKEIIKNTAVHPQMPLIINVSLASQRVRVYDANGLFAESPVSTGMPGHPTPMGVFSVIQKDRYHQSNIYSGAPMPYMQRITWSGIALHAGVVPGHPASHGCIRVPESFAVKMWGWTKMGARVIVSPGELSPSSFEHELLPTMKVAPQPQVSEAKKEPTGPKLDKGEADIKPAKANLELRSTVGHNEDGAQRDMTRTADASTVQAGKTTLSDATSAARDSFREAPPKASDSKTESAVPAADVAKNAADASAGPKNDVAAETPKPADTAPVMTKSAAHNEAKPEQSGATPETAPPLADPTKDQTRQSGSDKPPKPDARRKEGQLAVFISRKDSKLYVRQNFAPAWEAPVTIAPGDRPLGTHVFTATVDRKDSNLLHWTVLTVPMSARAAMRASDEPLPRRQKRKAAPGRAEAKPTPLPDRPAEALERITIPPEAMARISEALTTGASIIVSDQGINQGETGEYTDFIIRVY
jgi:lipoprotein-anchoring transpeptidase ErfK/SrfK